MEYGGIRASHTTSLPGGMSARPRAQLQGAEDGNADLRIHRAVGRLDGEKTRTITQTHPVWDGGSRVVSTPRIHGVCPGNS